VMVRTWVADKTVHCYTRVIYERFRDKKVINSFVYYCLLYLHVGESIKLLVRAAVIFSGALFRRSFFFQKYLPTGGVFCCHRFRRSFKCNYVPWMSDLLLIIITLHIMYIYKQCCYAGFIFIEFSEIISLISIQILDTAYTKCHRTQCLECDCFPVIVKQKVQYNMKFITVFMFSARRSWRTQPFVL